MSNPSVKGTKCPIDEDGIVVLEIDHYNGQCICFMCTCDNHKCPANKQKIYPKSTFTTNYKKNFTPHKALTPSGRVSSKYRISPHKLETTTTNSFEFKPPPVFYKPKREKQDFHLRPAMKLTYSSNYQSDYISWGPVSKNINRSPKEVHATNLKFTANTTYAQDFRPKTLSPPQKVTYSVSVKNINRGIDTYESTQRKDFRSKKYSFIKAEKVTAKPTLNVLSCHPEHFASTNSKFYKGTNSVRDHRRMRRQARSNLRL